jgi:hypothetical protein
MLRLGVAKEVAQLGDVKSDTGPLQPSLRERLEVPRNNLPELPLPAACPGGRPSSEKPNTHLVVMKSTWRPTAARVEGANARAKVDINAAQQRLGHSRPTTLLIHYAQVLDASADTAAGLLSGQLGYTIPAESAVNPFEV